MEATKKTSQQTTETTISADSKAPYILTEENWSSIPAMIGITEADLQEIFEK